MIIATLSFIYNSLRQFASFIYTVATICDSVWPVCLDASIIGVIVFYLTRLRKPDQSNVLNIFGPEPGSKESEENPEKVVKCIAHRGAGLDAPENTLQAFKYVSNCVLLRHFH